MINDIKKDSEEFTWEEAAAEVFEILDHPKKGNHKAEESQALEVALRFLRDGLQLDCMPGLSESQKKRLTTRSAKKYFADYQRLTFKARQFMPRAMSLLVRLIEREGQEQVSLEWGLELLEALTDYQPGAGLEWVSKQLSSPFA
ncbi:MAG: hypothetical protein JW991_00675 [Candidatus Pacebacteria bacterium]|nr:hypothetical protein [Candidatus Paceibacterota bacterium]